MNDEPCRPDSREERNKRKKSFDNAREEMVNTLKLAHFILSNMDIAQNIFYAVDEGNNDGFDAILSTAVAMISGIHWANPEMRRFIRSMIVEMSTRTREDKS